MPTTSIAAQQGYKGNKNTGKKAPIPRINAKIDNLVDNGSNLRAFASVTVGGAVAIHIMSDFIPKWHRELDIFCKIKPLILLEGNVLDLRLIYEVNPLDDLLEYGSNFEFGTDNPDFIEVEFTLNTDVLSQAYQTLSRREYNDLLQDFLCSLSIRIARDMFALLPINHTIIHAVMDHNTVLSVDFDRKTLSKVKYAFVDPSETIKKFRFEMNFNQSSGLSPISRRAYRECIYC